MKIRVFLATATAASVLMGAVGFAADKNVTTIIQKGVSATGNLASVDQSGGDNNLTKFTQEGSYNTVSVEQNGSNNKAGAHLRYVADPDASGDTGRNYDFILQKGDNNTIDIVQNNKGNIVAVGSGHINQFGDFNLIDIEQAGGSSAGSTVRKIDQTASDSAASRTNELYITQSGADPNVYPDLPLGSSDYNYARALVDTVSQTHTGGVRNLVDIDQTGGTHNAGNVVSLVSQNGSDNEADIDQSGRLNLLSSLTQMNDGNRATSSQSGYNNHIALISQHSTEADGNSASVVQNGTDNGRNGLGKAASLVGASDSSVVQFGVGNIIDYTANGDDNEFGFHQDGTGNLAQSITINGSRNHLGVFQDGTNNVLQLASIDGDDNVIGIRQVGTDNTVGLTIAAGGDRNGGYHGAFDALTAGPGLTPGLLEQLGVNNEVSLNVSGDDNLFATLQDNESAGSTGNKISGNITGSGNQAAVKQVGDNNTTSFVQTGSNNFVEVIQ